MPEIQITINTENGTFCQDPKGLNLNDVRPALTDTLRRIAHYIDVNGMSCPDAFNVLDRSGNPCGKVEIKRAAAPAIPEPKPPRMSYKKYKCQRCGYEMELQTNHHGQCWSVGHSNACPDCPPWAKYSEFGGRTVWECQEKDPDAPAATA